MKKILNLILLLLIATMSYANINRSDLPVNKNFMLTEYLGKWYEIVRLPNSFESRCLVPITAFYSLDKDNHGLLKVKNSCKWPTGKFDVAIGQGKFVAESTTAKLKINFLPSILRYFNVGWGDYWVLYTDYKRYSIVGSPDYKYLWILSRSENPPVEDINKLVEFADKLQFPIQNLIYNYPQYSPQKPAVTK